MDYSIVRKIFFDCFRFDTFDYEQTKILTVAHDDQRNLLRHGRYYAPLIDTIEDDLRQLGIRCVSIARIVSKIKGDSSYGNVRSPEGHFARALVGKRLKKLFSKGQYPFSQMEERTWMKILNATRADRLIGIQPSRELCVACHKSGVWVADLQHGVIADGHPWYGEIYRARDPVEWLPDAFLLWDHGSEKVLSKWTAEKGIATKVIGNRWVARFLQPTANDRLANELLREFSVAAKEESGRKNILISLSWSEIDLHGRLLAAVLEGVIRKTADKYRWFIRLHPSQLKGTHTDQFDRFLRFFDQHLLGFAEWELATKWPLPVVLANCVLHLTWRSSVCIEAAQMGVKSALLDPKLRWSDGTGNWFQYYTQKGLIDLIEDSEGIVISWINRHVATNQPKEPYQAFDDEYRRLMNFLST